MAGNQAYKKLWTYRYTTIIYDLTAEFIKNFILSRGNKNFSNLGLPDSRTADQMNQAARSGKQNIVEGSEAMKTSLKSAVKLTNVARASIEELLQDYEDFLRQHNFKVWSKEQENTKNIREYFSRYVKGGDLSNLSILRNRLSKNTPEVAANIVLTLCHQATYLLNKQVEGMERKLIEEGGYSENICKKRKNFRGY
ncbi:four helix bundle protein [candidate division WWE3 bacterium CG10_big_fil_rev_8_21_14_0_10_32_10]|uniref:Four helix bundle protein n=1 Tax=candidate division WWE3 bacterium CG10_big_fil_rev_8_21_14_0_10_32_10 TaxID=1975090 RepID=A0A2H0RBE5_UNCKA|nr:MAG: four helix bundle protein [candidate division WWE3 bacterium CG10_big_fil_rev_8_21_14_0_10_32_10]